MARGSLKDGCQAIRNILLVLVPHKGAHGTTTAVIQISILSTVNSKALVSVNSFKHGLRQESGPEVQARHPPALCVRSDSFCCDAELDKVTLPSHDAKHAPGIIKIAPA